MLDDSTSLGEGYHADRDLTAQGNAPDPRGSTVVDWSHVEEVPEDQRLRSLAHYRLHPAKLQAYVRERVKAADAEYRERYKDWRRNRDYLTSDLDRHFEARLRPEADAPWKQAYSPNIARSAALTHKQHILARNFSASFEASSDSLNDAQVAEAAAAIAEYQDRHNDPKRLRSDAMDCALVGSMGFGKIRLNPNAGRLIGADETGMPVYEGMVDVEIRPPWSVIADVDAEEYAGDDGLKKARWVFDRYHISRDELEATLPAEHLARVKRAEKPRSVDESGGDGDLDRLRDPMGGTWRSQMSTDERREGYEVIEFFQRRSPRFPSGLYAKLVNGVLVDGGAAPYADLDTSGELDLPFALFSPYRCKGQFPGVPLMSLLCGPQDAVRKVESRNLERFIIGATKIVARGCGEIVGEWTDQDGQFIEMSGTAGQIDVIKGQTPKPDDYVIADRAIAHMDRAASAYAVARGEQEGDATARQVSLLRDAVDIAAGEVVDHHNAVFRAVRKKEFALVKHAYNFPRLVEIKGEDDVVSTRAFMGADLEGLTDYTITSDALLPAGRTAKLAFMQGLVELGKGIGEPIMGAKEVRQLLGVKKGLLSDEQRIRQRARRASTDMLRSGTPHLVHPRERHDLWIEVMQDILESAEYDGAPMQARIVFDLHLEQRHALVAQAAMQAAALMAPPPKGDAGGQGPPALSESLNPIESAA